MEVEIPTEETEPLLRQEITSSLQRPEDVYNNSVQNTAFDVHGDAIDERPRGRCCIILTKLKFALFDAHWPLSCFLAVAFLGFWLPKKDRSLWPLTFIPIFHMLFGLGTHLYFIVLANDQTTLKVHIGSKKATHISMDKRFFIVYLGFALLQISVTGMDARSEQNSTPSCQRGSVYWFAACVMGPVRRCLLSRSV